MQITSVITNYTIPLTAVLISRFLLHLQSASLRAAGSMASSQVSSMDLNNSVIFERVIGSLAASITMDDYIRQEDGRAENVMSISTEDEEEPTHTSQE
ncbi:hypothetical protein BD309DRAFT_72731 [Dichomitus squalens]|nr:hypothetical protein BD309DRAFT_72731 [Dichomitus squalens]